MRLQTMWKSQQDHFKTSMQAIKADLKAQGALQRKMMSMKLWACTITFLFWMIKRKLEWSYKALMSISRYTSMWEAQKKTEIYVYEGLNS